MSSIASGLETTTTHPFRNGILNGVPKYYMGHTWWSGWGPECIDHDDEDSGRPDANLSVPLGYNSFAADEDVECTEVREEWE